MPLATLLLPLSLPLFLCLLAVACSLALAAVAILLSSTRRRHHHHHHHQYHYSVTHALALALPALSPLRLIKQLVWSAASVSPSLPKSFLLQLPSDTNSIPPTTSSSSSSSSSSDAKVPPAAKRSKSRSRSTHYHHHHIHQKLNKARRAATHTFIAPSSADSLSRTSSFSAPESSAPQQHGHDDVAMAHSDNLADIYPLAAAAQSHTSAESADFDSYSRHLADADGSDGIYGGNDDGNATTARDELDTDAEDSTHSSVSDSDSCGVADDGNDDALVAVAAPGDVFSDALSYGADTKPQQHMPLSDSAYSVDTVPAAAPVADSTELVPTADSTATPVVIVPLSHESSVALAASTPGHGDLEANVEQHPIASSSPPSQYRDSGYGERFEAFDAAAPADTDSVPDPEESPAAKAVVDATATDHDKSLSDIVCSILGNNASEAQPLLSTRRTLSVSQAPPMETSLPASVDRVLVPFPTAKDEPAASTATSRSASPDGDQDSAHDVFDPPASSLSLSPLLATQLRSRAHTWSPFSGLQLDVPVRTLLGMGALNALPDADSHKSPAISSLFDDSNTATDASSIVPRPRLVLPLRASTASSVQQQRQSVDTVSALPNVTSSRLYPSQHNNTKRRSLPVGVSVPGLPTTSTATPAVPVTNAASPLSTTQYSFNRGGSSMLQHRKSASGAGTWVSRTGNPGGAYSSSAGGTPPAAGLGHTNYHHYYSSQMQTSATTTATSYMASLAQQQQQQQQPAGKSRLYPAHAAASLEQMRARSNSGGDTYAAMVQPASSPYRTGQHGRGAAVTSGAFAPHQPPPYRASFSATGTSNATGQNVFSSASATAPYGRDRSNSYEPRNINNSNNFKHYNSPPSSVSSGHDHRRKSSAAIPQHNYNYQYQYQYHPSQPRRFVNNDLIHLALLSADGNPNPDVLSVANPAPPPAADSASTPQSPSPSAGSMSPTASAH